MAKRFTATEIWSEDWFLDMPTEYKLFWYYMLTACDHAGIFKVNVRSFCGLNGLKISAGEAFAFFNSGKQRLRLISDSVWFIEDFFVYQYGDHFNINNPLHRGVKKQLDIHEIELTSIRGLKDLNLTPKSVQKEGTQALKDKEKDKDNNKNSNPVVNSPKEEGGMGETREEDAPKLNDTMLAPKMLAVFKNTFPKYSIDTEKDFGCCVEIAYKICKEKGWGRYYATNSNLEDLLLEWRKVVDFIKTDSYYSGLSIEFLKKQWSGLTQKMSKPIHHAPNQQTTASSSAGLQSGSKSTSRINAIATAGIGNRNRPS